jgi:hypothetical protein
MRIWKRKTERTLDPELRRRVEVRAQEILEEDPAERSARTMRRLAERIAYHEILAEQKRATEPN